MLQRMQRVPVQLDRAVAVLQAINFCGKVVRQIVYDIGLLVHPSNIADPYVVWSPLLPVRVERFRSETTGHGHMRCRAQSLYTKDA